MVLKNSALKRTSFIVVLCLAFNLPVMVSQTAISNVDSVFTKLFDADLNTKTLSYSELFSKPTVIISNVNCIVCAEYFSKAKKDFNFVFIIGNESLGEINRILAYYNLKKKEVYFTTCKYIQSFKSTLCGNPTPCMAYKQGNRFCFLDYHELDRITGEFSIKIDLLKERLR